MHFAGRDLKPYSQPVSASELVVGEVYFAVNYVDDEMLIPTVETVVFVGRNLTPGDVECVYFQDVNSYRDGVRYDTKAGGGKASFQCGSEKEVGHIFNFEPALDELMRCSLRRRDAAARANTSQ